MTHADPPLAAGRIPVIGGFVGATRDGVTTTLGRGGSDFSAAIVGACLGAAEIQIWTDVDGMLTADPRIVKDPQVVPHLSFAEASELAYFGAKVLHPATIQPAVARNIPVRILNSHRANARGTLITAERPQADRPLTAVASKKGVTVVDITSTRMLMAHGFLRRLFEVFERFKTSVDVVTTSEVSVSVTIDDAPAAAGDRRGAAEICGRLARGRHGDRLRGRRRPARDPGAGGAGAGVGRRRAACGWCRRRRRGGTSPSSSARRTCRPRSAACTRSSSRPIRCRRRSPAREADAMRLLLSATAAWAAGRVAGPGVRLRGERRDRRALDGDAAMADGAARRRGRGDRLHARRRGAEEPAAAGRARHQRRDRHHRLAGARGGDAGGRRRNAASACWRRRISRWA